MLLSGTTGWILQHKYDHGQHINVYNVYNTSTTHIVQIRATRHCVVEYSNISSTEETCFTEISKQKFPDFFLEKIMFSETTQILLQ